MLMSVIQITIHKVLEMMLFILFKLIILQELIFHCGANGAQFDSYLYLVKDTNVQPLSEMTIFVQYNQK